MIVCVIDLRSCNVKIIIIPVSGQPTEYWYLYIDFDMGEFWGVLNMVSLTGITEELK